MLQENVITGLCFIIGIAFNSPLLLFGSCVSAIASLSLAKYLKYEAEEINKGLYGYNAALVGCAVLYFMKPTLLSIALLIVGGMLSAIIMNFMLQKVRRVLAFTTPFIVTTWLIFILLELSNMEISTMPFDDPQNNILHITMRGVSQVMFQNDWISGCIFIIGLFFSSFKVTAWVIAASVLAIISARLFNFSDDLIILGVYSFNACLVVIALNVLYSRRFWPILVAIVITTLLTKGFIALAIPALTAPFVLTSWLVIALVRPSNLVIKH